MHRGARTQKFRWPHLLSASDQRNRCVSPALRRYGDPTGSPARSYDKGCWEAARSEVEPVVAAAAAVAFAFVLVGGCGVDLGCGVGYFAQPGEDLIALV